MAVGLDRWSVERQSSSHMSQFTSSCCLFKLTPLSRPIRLQSSFYTHSMSTSSSPASVALHPSTPPRTGFNSPVCPGAPVRVARISKYESLPLDRRVRNLILEEYPFEDNREAQRAATAAEFRRFLRTPMRPSTRTHVCPGAPMKTRRIDLACRPRMVDPTTGISRQMTPEELAEYTQHFARSYRSLRLSENPTPVSLHAQAHAMVADETRRCPPIRCNFRLSENPTPVSLAEQAHAMVAETNNESQKKE